MRRRVLCPAGFCLGLWLGTGLGASKAAWAGWGLAPLMQSMAEIRSSSASFIESKTLPMLNAPLQASGTLDYVAPDYIRKTTTSPVAEDFVLRQGEVTLTGPGNQVHRFALAQEPAIGGLAEGIRATLAGDLPALERIYRVQLSGGPSRWQLVLTPKDPALAHFIAWMAISGAGNRISEIDTASGDGGRSEMHVRETSLVTR